MHFSDVVIPWSACYTNSFVHRYYGNLNPKSKSIKVYINWRTQKKARHAFGPKGGHVHLG